MKRIVLAATASMLALCAVPALAQNAQNSKEEQQEGDIIVTATRSNTLLSKTPIAMTAISSEGLRDAGITDSRALTNAVPNLQISANGDAVRISIRGVTSTDTTEKGDPSAAFLFNGAYIARPIEVLNSFYDLERVEVLRGPQGTLFGRNTTAGVIHVISARPKDTFAASVDAGYGNLNQANVTGMINLGLGNGIGIRAAVNYDRSDNYVIQAQPATRSIDPYRNNISGRLSLGGSLDKFKFLIVGDYSHAKGSTFNSVPLTNFFPGAISPRVDAAYVSKPSDLQRTAPAIVFPDARNNKFYGISGEFSYDFGPVELTYLGSYRKADRSDVRNLVAFGGLNASAKFDGTFNQNSHELRLAFGKGSALHGQVGAYLFQEESTIAFIIGQPLSAIVAGGSGPPNFNAVGFGFPQGPTKAKSQAVFGQLTYDVTQDLHLTGGIRYTSDDKSRVGATILDFNTVANSFCGQLRCALNSNIASRNYKKTTWKVGVDYDAPDLGLIYASVSTGYKAGGFNDGCVTGSAGGLGCSLTAAQLYYDPETITSYEAGFKFRFADNAVRLNGSIFHYDYSALQLSQITGSPPVNLTRNAAKAKVDGVELEAILQPSTNDRVELGFTYTNARYANFLASALFGPPGSQFTLSRDFNGLPLDHAPKYSASAAYTHTFVIGDGKLEATIRTRLSSEYFMADLNNLSQFRQPGFSKTDLTLTYRAPGGRWYLQGYAKNLEDKITLAAASTGIVTNATPEEPRTFGIRAGFKF